MDSSPLFPITYYLIGHPLIALGLAMLAILCVVSVLRRQVRTAIALWALVFMTFLYVYLQTKASPAPAVTPTEAVSDEAAE